MKMASLHSGCNELLSIETDKLYFVIKGHSPLTRATGYSDLENKSSLVISNKTSGLSLFILGEDRSKNLNSLTDNNTKECKTIPLFREQQNYEIIIELKEKDELEKSKVSFWHENVNLRNKVTPIGRNQNILSGVINFGNEIGYSDLSVLINEKVALSLRIEVFPSKIDYYNDYIHLLDDISKEVYNLIFDFLKKTYVGYNIGNSQNSSLGEFFAIVRVLFSKFIKAADMILRQPHHILETTHEVLPVHKIKKIDSRTIRWLQKHQEQLQKVVPSHNNSNAIIATKALAVRKQVSFNTKENQFTKHILLSIVRRFEQLKKNYQKLYREKDQKIIDEINSKSQQISHRCCSSFLSEVDELHELCSMSLVFSMAPGYRDLYKYYLMLRHGLSVFGNVYNISTKDLSALYEYWCFIKLNSLMKDRYKLISQNIISVRNDGIFVSLIKGQKSRVEYVNPNNGEKITLTYNQKETSTPTVAQKPDNILSLEKNTLLNDGNSLKYEYVFDAKYRINMAEDGSDYKNNYKTPGPETDDINTMHRYRDAIVSEKRKGNYSDSYERTMFGAYVLFPYGNEDEYRQHHFYKTIDAVNIGGLPFLPSATNMVSSLLDELVEESPLSAFGRTTLPKNIEYHLARTDWSKDKRDVLVINTISQELLKTSLDKRCFYLPKSEYIKIQNIADSAIHYLALYQPINNFGARSGIKYYGEIQFIQKVSQQEIISINPQHKIKDSNNSTEEYCVLNVLKWIQLPRTLEAGGVSNFPIRTNMFLLQNSSKVQSLLISTKEEYLLYAELMRLTTDLSVNASNGQKFSMLNGLNFKMENDNILVTDSNKNISHTIGLSNFVKNPVKFIKSVMLGQVKI